MPEHKSHTGPVKPLGFVPGDEFRGGLFQALPIEPHLLRPREFVFGPLAKFLERKRRPHHVVGIFVPQLPLFLQFGAFEFAEPMENSRGVPQPPEPPDFFIQRQSSHGSGKQ